MMHKEHMMSDSEMKRMMRAIKMGEDMTIMSKPKIGKLVSAKISKIMHEGIRGKKVKKDQAVAVAYSMMRKRGHKV